MNAPLAVSMLQFSADAPPRPRAIPYHDAPFSGRDIVVGIACHVLGAGWMADCVRRADAGGIERRLS